MSRIRDRAAQYLALKIYDITDPYQMAITTFALQRVGHRSKDDAYARLKTMRRTGEQCACSM